MTLLRGALLTVALCSGPTALAQSHPDLVVTPAWGGWARPARATELDVRVASDVATRATLTVNAGRQTLRAPLALEPGRPVRLHLPVSSADEIVVTAGDLRQPVAVSRSEAPLLAVALQSGEPVHFADFHAVTVTPDALPRNASAYAAVDALVIDAPTLASLDERQLSALVSDAAQCGRMIVLNADARVRDVLQRAAGCGGTAAVFAGSLTQGLDGFMASLAKALPTAIGTVRPPEIRRTHDATWQRVIALAAGSFIAIALTLVWSRRWPVLAAVPVLATGTVLAFLHALAPVSRVVVWSESESGGQLARYTAWQSLPGTTRRSTRTELPPQLRAPISCDPLQASLLEFDVDSGRAIAAVFDTRLFRPVVICYSGELVAARTV